MAIKHISPAQRHRSATIVQKTKGPRGGTTRYRFPMPDKAHARDALARVGNAKELSYAQKLTIIRRALKMLGTKVDATKWASSHGIR